MNSITSATLRSIEGNANNYGNKKELVGAYSVVGTLKGQLKEIVCCRSYMGRSRSASTVYASVWVKLQSGEWTSGKGSAGGYGYHKESAAIGYAIASAGIELSDAIDGRGDSAIDAALLAIGRMAGGEGELLLIRHS